MKYSTATLVAAIATGVVAQDLSQLPTCARSAALTGITSTGCQLTDIACICKSTSFLQSVAAAIQTTCSAEEQQQTYAFAANLCSQAGVTISTPGASGGASTAASSAAETSAAASTTAAETSAAETTAAETSAAETTTEAATEPASTVATTESATAIPTDTAAPSTYPAGNGTATTLPTVVPVPVPSGNATATGGAGGSGTTSPIPSPTFVNSAAAKAGSIVFSVVMAAVAVFAL